MSVEQGFYLKLHQMMNMVLKSHGTGYTQDITETSQHSSPLYALRVH